MIIARGGGSGRTNQCHKENEKCRGNNGISAELINYGGKNIIKEIYKLIRDIVKEKFPLMERSNINTTAQELYALVIEELFYWIQSNKYCQKLLKFVYKKTQKKGRFQT